MENSCSGVLLLDKPAGMTSHDVVGKIRRLYGTREVGHTGTLDPIATGLLVVLVGRAVKASEFLTAEQKTYRAAMQLGITTDTQDITGRILTRVEHLPTEAEVRRAAASFLGPGEQVPPMVSALKVGGKKLCDLARAGITVERKARPIEILSLDLLPQERPDAYWLTVRCTKGTYIRTLCHDIGQALGCGAVMTSLERLESGPFSLSMAQTLAELEAMEPLERLRALLALDRVFADAPALRLPPFFDRLAKNGCEIYQQKIGSAFAEGTLVRLYDAGGFYALARAVSFPAGSALRPVKFFRLS